MTQILNLLSYPRAVIVTIWGLIHTFICSFVVIFIAAIFRTREAVDFGINTLWSYPMIFAAGAKVEVRGRENGIGESKGFLILFNHSSFFDIPILYYYFPRSFRFGAKIELFQIPVFGKAMELAGALPIDRGNRNKVMQVYQNAITRVNNGEAFALAPEGTRQKEPTLGRFKRGPFEFAINAQMDIVPVIIAGAYDVLPKSSFLVGAGKWRHKVVLEILPRVHASEYSIENVEQLQEKVRGMMEPVYQRLNQELAAKT